MNKIKCTLFLLLACLLFMAKSFSSISVEEEKILLKHGLSAEQYEVAIQNVNRLEAYIAIKCTDLNSKIEQERKKNTEKTEQSEEAEKEMISKLIECYTSLNALTEIKHALFCAPSFLKRAVNLNFAYDPRKMLSLACPSTSEEISRVKNILESYKEIKIDAFVDEESTSGVKEINKLRLSYVRNFVNNLHSANKESVEARGKHQLFFHGVIKELDWSSLGIVQSLLSFIYGKWNALAVEEKKKFNNNFLSFLKHSFTQKIFKGKVKECPVETGHILFLLWHLSWLLTPPALTVYKYCSLIENFSSKPALIPEQ